MVCATETAPLLLLCVQHAAHRVCVCADAVAARQAEGAGAPASNALVACEQHMQENTVVFKHCRAWNCGRGLQNQCLRLLLQLDQCCSRLADATRSDQHAACLHVVHTGGLEPQCEVPALTVACYPSQQCRMLRHHKLHPAGSPVVHIIQAPSAHLRGRCCRMRRSAGWTSPHLCRLRCTVAGRQGTCRRRLRTPASGCSGCRTCRSCWDPC